MSRINFNQFEESMTLSLATTEIYYTLISGTRQHFYDIYFNFCAKSWIKLHQPPNMLP
jgi:hypothetical protein